MGYPTDEILSYNFLYAKKGRIPLFLQKFFEKFSWSRKRGTNHRLSLALGAGVCGGGGEELRWMPEYTQFSTLDTRYDED